MGFRTVAIGRGGDKEPLARKLGAHEYIDTSAGAPVRPMIERYPLGKAADAYDQMISGRARFRVVLTVAS